MDMQLERKYLNLPVKNEADKRRMRLVLDGETVREFEIELAEDEQGFWVFLDISMFRGKTVVLAVDDLPEDSKAFSLIHQDDTIKGSEDLYQEKYRPQFHFSSRRGWNNDPNGLVYYKGEYHLYYQRNPYSWKWGNLHWGHAVSTDLVHWKELPIGIYPSQFGDWVSSGCAFVDWHNRAGFKTGEEDVIIAAYTSLGRGENIAYSNDRGRTFTDYEGCPVMEHPGRAIWKGHRDPKVIWYEPGNHWVMAVYDKFEGRDYIDFYTSSNLRDWEFQSRIEGYYECPEIFQLPVDGDPNSKKWVVYAADGAYAIGSFDGKQFVTESGKHRFSYGNCFYASQTFSDIPEEDGRRIQIAWGTIGHPDMPFNQMMDFPVELTLRTTESGIRMFAEPVAELEKLHSQSHVWENEKLKEGENLLKDITGELFHIRAEFHVGEAAAFGLKVRGVDIEYNASEEQITCGDNHADLEPHDGKIRLQVLVDRVSIEIFANDGEIYMPMSTILPDDEGVLATFSQGGSTRVSQLIVHELESAWQ